MTDVAITTDDRPKPKRSNGATHAAVLVSGYEWRGASAARGQNVDLLASQGIIERRAADNLFDQDVSRLKYLAHLRAEHRRSPRAAADAEFALAKAELIRLRVAERKRDLIPREEAASDMEHLRATESPQAMPTGWPARRGTSACSAFRVRRSHRPRSAMRSTPGLAISK